MNQIKPAKEINTILPIIPDIKEDSIIQTPKKYIYEFIKINKFVEKEYLFDEITLNIYEDFQERGILKKIDKKLISLSIDFSVQEILKEKRNIFLKSIEYNEENFKENIKLLKLFLKNYLGYCDKYTLKTWYRFLQNIKIKLLSNGKETLHDPFMIIIYSENQGLGKSWNIQHNLFGPLDENNLYKNGSFQDLTNDKYSDSLRNKAVVFLDEMGGRSELYKNKDRVKTILSSNSVGVNQKFKDPRNINILASFIGSSNEPITDFYKDRGMRRFRQFVMKTKISKDSKKAKILNNIDYTKLWQSINPKLESIYNEDYEEAKKEHIKNITSEDNISRFINYFDIFPKLEDEVEIIKRQEVFSIYKNFMYDEELRKYTKSRPEFYKIMENKNIKSKRINQYGWVYKKKKNRKGEESFNSSKINRLPF